MKLARIASDPPQRPTHKSPVTRLVRVVVHHVKDLAEQVYTGTRDSPSHRPDFAEYFTFDALACFSGVPTHQSRPR